MGDGCGGRVCLFVAVLCALSFVEGVSVNGLPNINISNLERRFELTSSQAGLISSSGDIGAISFVLFVSFYGGSSHRPRVVGGGGFFMCLGCFLFLLPHIFVKPYTIGVGSEEMEGCSNNPQPLNCSRSGSGQGSATRLYPLFLLGQALQGIGFTPAFTCGFAYIDDHATSEHTAVYIGITYAITALGVGVGYVMGGNLLSLWVDIDRVDVSKVQITNSDKRWVGAWWIGYSICAILFFIVSCLLCTFPRYLPGSKMLQNKFGGMSTATRGHHRQSLAEYVLAFPQALLNLICNPLYIVLVLVGLGDSLIVSGIAGFAPKIIEEKFNVKPTESGLIMGTVTLMGGAGGMAMGGFLIQKFHLKLRGIMRMCLLFLMFGGVLGGGCFFISCPQQRFAGLNSIYGLAKHKAPEESDLRADCNLNCTCSTLRFDPVCGQDGVTYFSSCFAGCPSRLVKSFKIGNGTRQMHSNCSCVLDTLLDSGLQIVVNGSAVSGECSGACPQVWPFVVVLFLGILFTFLTVTPISVGILRCVPSAERSVGLGLQWVTLRLLGTIPGPILTGSVLDSSCQVWQSTCHGRGNCWVYDGFDLSLRLFLLWVVVKISALCLLLIAYTLYNKRGNAIVEMNEQNMESISVAKNHPHNTTSDQVNGSVNFHDSRSGPLPDSPHQLYDPSPLQPSGESEEESKHIKNVRLKGDCYRRGNDQSLKEDVEYDSSLVHQAGVGFLGGESKNVDSPPVRGAQDINLQTAVNPAGADTRDVSPTGGRSGQAVPRASPAPTGAPSSRKKLQVNSKAISTAL
ncbi:hypothetical protein ACOMHN_015309 [Nucella lapillus]